MRCVGLGGALLLTVLFRVDVSAQVRYTIQPISGESITRLDVTVSARGEPDGTTRFALPEDRFGVAQMWHWIDNVRTAPRIDLIALDDGIYELKHTPAADVEVSYTISYDPTMADFTPFGPSVDGDHFHFFGSQWMARVGPSRDSDEVRREVEVVLQQDGWEGSWASSFGLGPGLHRVHASDYDLDYSVIAGGNYRMATVDCRGRPIVVAAQGELDIPDADIFAVSGRVACSQREVFADFDYPFFTIFVTEREDLVAGAPLLNGFTAFVESTISEEELMELLSHEMIHTWLPRSARLVEPGLPDAPESRTRWFHEGFTEYLSRLVLVQQGLMPRSWMVERTNEDLERLAYHPYRTLSLDEIEVAGREGEYSALHHRLHYVRGALLASIWDARIRGASRGESSILDPLRRVLWEARGQGGTIALPALSHIFERFGVDAAGDVARHLEGGVPLRPVPGAFGSAYDLRTRKIPAFEPGFDVLHWLSEDRVAEVSPGSAADRAGLHDGMLIVGSRNAAPWNGRWDPTAPSVFIVESLDEAGEAERSRFEVHAAGAPIEIPVYVRNDRVPD